LAKRKPFHFNHLRSARSCNSVALTHYRTVVQAEQKPQQGVNGTKTVAKLKPHMSELPLFLA